MEKTASVTETSYTRDIERLARNIRIHTVRMIHAAKSSHTGSCLSMAELLAVLYGRILRIDPAWPDWSGRDRFILSKGHACAALYAVRPQPRFSPKGGLEIVPQNRSRLAGHVQHAGGPGVEVSAGRR